MFQINATESGSLEVKPAVSVECFGLAIEDRDGQPSDREQYLIADVVHSMFVQQTSLSFREQTGLVGGSRGKLLAVAGAEAAGRVGASGRALATLSEYIGTLTPRFVRSPTTEDLAATLEAALDAADPSRDLTAENATTTLCAAYVLWPQLHLMNVGQGRVYLLRRGVLGRLTSEVEVGYDPCLCGDCAGCGDHVCSGANGHGTNGHGANGHGANGHGANGHGANGTNGSSGDDQVLSSHGYLFCSRNVGPSNSEILRQQLHANDAVLLCSKALPAYVSDERIAAVLNRAASPESACRALIDESKKAGCRGPLAVLVAHCRAS